MRLRKTGNRIFRRFITFGPLDQDPSNGKSQSKLSSQWPEDAPCRPERKFNGRNFPAEGAWFGIRISGFR